MVYRKRDIERLVEHLEEQGCTVRFNVRKSTWFVQFPDGEGTAFHSTISDKQRGLKNQRAKVVRSGLSWPEWFRV